jgi:hypothetical protein
MRKNAGRISENQQIVNGDKIKIDKSARRRELALLEMLASNQNFAKAQFNGKAAMINTNSFMILHTVIIYLINKFKLQLPDV